MIKLFDMKMLAKCMCNRFKYQSFSHWANLVPQNYLCHGKNIIKII